MNHESQEQEYDEISAANTQGYLVVQKKKMAKLKMEVSNILGGHSGSEDELRA